jgi:adenylate kinase family enzyme
MTGLCGSGKTALTKRLAKKFKIQSLTIGVCRDAVKKLYDMKQPEKKVEYLADNIRILLETQAWVLFTYTVLKKLEKGESIILDTSGMNKRLNFLIDNLWGVAEVIRIKLICPLKILKKRIQQRVPKQEGFFPYEYSGHMDLNKDLIKGLKRIRAHITINTNKLSINEVYKKVIRELKKYGVK